ncbi:unnamed protein product [Hapterophycus canaliculatus]
MVSLTFDEFHAIRSRQRAAADAEAATAASAATPSSRTTPSDQNPKDKPPKHRQPAKPSIAASPASTKHSGGVSISSPRRSTAWPSSLPPGASDDTKDDKIAPTSGSGFHKQPQQHQQLKKSNGAEKINCFNSAWGGGRVMGTVANLGRFVELFEVQVAVVAMIYLDLVASTAQLLPFLDAVVEGGRGEGAPKSSSGASFSISVARLVSRLMQSFTGFTVIFFALEVVMLLAAFRGKFFRHLGYVLDMLVVSACLYAELAGKGKGVRLLGALRVWRVARVMNTLLLSAEGAHEQTRDTLRLAEKSTQDIETDRRRLQETLRREVEARKRVDKMLRGYKDEVVETLNEALKIAAMDIATAGVSTGKGSEGDKDQLPYRGEPSADSDAESSTGSSENGSGYESVDGSDEGRIPHQRRPSSSSGGAGGRSAANRIFVFQDGTFQAR